jgi:endonuclease/exonuclease/phosphatase family metal-dependent hydrolase
MNTSGRFVLPLPRLVLLLLVLTATLVGREALAAEPLTIRVLSYNIHHGEGIDGKLDLSRIAGVITAVKPDLVALQEVDRHTRRTEQLDQPAILSKLTGMKILFEKNIVFQGGDYGNAILSRFPVKAYRNHKLPSHDEGEQRGALEAEILLPGGHGTLILWSTHLDHRPDPIERLASARALEKIVRAKGETVGLLAGDLNSQLRGQVLPVFLRSWTNSNGLKPLPTVPVKEPKRQIDFVFYRPPQRWRVKSVRVLEEQVASDHRALLSVLELLPAASR